LSQSPKISSNTLAQNEQSSLEHFGPDIPFPTDRAFFPIEPDLSGVYYQWRECSKKFLGVCYRWRIKKITFKFDDKNQMRFFKDNDFGLLKRRNP